MKKETFEKEISDLLLFAEKIGFLKIIELRNSTECICNFLKKRYNLSK